MTGVFQKQQRFFSQKRFYVQVQGVYRMLGRFLFFEALECSKKKELQMYIFRYIYIYIWKCTPLKLNICTHINTSKIAIFREIPFFQGSWFWGVCISIYIYSSPSTNVTSCPVGSRWKYPSTITQITIETISMLISQILNRWFYWHKKSLATPTKRAQSRLPTL